MRKRNGTARIELIDNGFILYHDYPNSIIAKPIYFETLVKLFEFLNEKVFADMTTF